MIRDVYDYAEPADAEEPVPGPTWAVGVSGGEPRRVRMPFVIITGLAVLFLVVAGTAAAGLIAYSDALQMAQLHAPLRPQRAASAPTASSATPVSATSSSTPATSAPRPKTAPKPKAVVSPSRQGAMAPTIVSAKYSVDYGAYRGRQPRIGDIVYLRAPDGSRVIRRVVGIGGDSVTITEGWVYLNGLGLQEPYVKYNDARMTIGAILVPKGAVFVIGDNRDRLKTQFWGVVMKSHVLGRVSH